MQATEDLFSMIVDPLRLEGAFVSTWRTGGDWSFEGPREACALFHYVEEGSMAIDIGHPNATIPLNQGDLAIFPHGGAHRIGSSTPAVSLALEQILPSRRNGGFVRVEIPGADGPALFLCAGLHCGGHASTPLYKLLPEIIVIRKHQIEREPLLQGTAQNFKGLMLLLATTQLLLIVDASIINVIVPTIAEELRFSETGQSWIANAYLSVFGGALLASGRIADILGRTRIFQAGLLVLATAVSAMASTPEFLIAGRAIQGLGSALSAAASLALILATFEGEQRYKALGLLAAIK